MTVGASFIYLWNHPYYKGVETCNLFQPIDNEAIMSSH